MFPLGHHIFGFKKNKPAKVPKRCTGVTIEYENLSTAHVKALVNALKGNTHVTALVLEGNYFVGDEGAVAVAEMLKENTVLTTLNLKTCNIHERGVKALAEALAGNTVVTQLNMRENSAMLGGAEALAAALTTEGTALQGLDIDDNTLSFEGSKAIIDAIATGKTQINTLALGNNELGDIGAVALAALLKTDHKLETLSIPFSQIGPEGGKAIAEALAVHPGPLERLNMESDEIGNEVASELVSAAVEHPETKLKMLDLRYSAITSSGAASIAATLGAKPGMLEKLNLGTNDLDTAGIKPFIDALQTNTVLELVQVDEHNVDAKVLADMRAALDRNREAKKRALPAAEDRGGRHSDL